MNTYRKKLIYLYGVSVFLLNSVVRSSLRHVSEWWLPGMLGSINVLALFAFIGLLILEFTSGHRRVNMFSLLTVLATIIFAVLAISSNINGINSKLGNWVVIATIVPGMLLTTMYNAYSVQESVKSVIKTINVAFSVLFLIGILDYFLGGVVAEFIAAYLSDESWANMIRTELSTYGFRMVTLIGAPLMNSYYALVMLAVNVVYTRYTGIKLINKAFLYCITGVTIVLTGSRTGLLLAVCFILVNEFLGKWGILKIIALIPMFAVFINTELFQNTVGARLRLGFNNKTDARYLLWTMFMSNEFGSLKLFSGGGYNYSRALTGSVYSSMPSLNFEYPFLMFAFDYGIIATVLYYVIFLLIPCLRFVSQKKYFAVFAYCIVFASLQTCNISAQFYDFNLQLGFIIVAIDSVLRRPVIKCKTTVSCN